MRGNVGESLDGGFHRKEQVRLGAGLGLARLNNFVGSGTWGLSLVVWYPVLG